MPAPDLALQAGEAVVVVMPARNTARTPERTFGAIPHAWFDEVIVRRRRLVDRLRPATVYGLETLGAAARLVLHRNGVWRSRTFVV